MRGYRIASQGLMLVLLSVSPVSAYGQCFVQFLQPPTLQFQDVFGGALALDGDWLFVGAHQDDDAGLEAGAVYVFLREDDGWAQVQKLMPPAPVIDESFGVSVGAFEDLLVVGAAHGGALGTGRAYVYRHIDGTWQLEQTLVPPDPAGAQSYGLAVGVADNQIFIGDRSADVVLVAQGAVHSYVFDGSTWVLDQTITAIPTSWGISFGASLAVSDDTLVVGAPGDDTSVLSGGGRSYVFGHDGVEWVQQSAIQAPVPAFEGAFGFSVATDGVRVAVGTPNAWYGGAVILYQFDGVDWVFEAELSGSDAEIDDWLGRSVAIEGARVIAGAPGVDPGGAAYVFDFDGSDWNETHKIAPPAADLFDSVGASVALQGPLAAISAHGEELAGAIAAGAAYLYTVDENPCFIRGDANGDGTFDIADAVFSLVFLFLPGSAAPLCDDATDTNDDGVLDLSDPIYTLMALFVPGSPTPPMPYPDCGGDFTPDVLACDSVGSCP